MFGNWLADVAGIRDVGVNFALLDRDRLEEPSTFLSVAGNSAIACMNT